MTTYITPMMKPPSEEDKLASVYLNKGHQQCLDQEAAIENDYKRHDAIRIEIENHRNRLWKKRTPYIVEKMILDRIDDLCADFKRQGSIIEMSVNLRSYQALTIRQKDRKLALELKELGMKHGFLVDFHNWMESDDSLKFRDNIFEMRPDFIVVADAPATFTMGITDVQPRKKKLMGKKKMTSLAVATGEDGEVC